MARGSGAGCPRGWTGGSGSAWSLGATRLDGWHVALLYSWGPRVWMGGTRLWSCGPTCLDGCLELLGGWHAALELGGQLWKGGAPSLNGWHAALEQGRNQREGLSPCFARLRLCGIQALWVHFVKRNAKAMNPPSSPVSRVRLPYSVRVPYVG